MTKADIPHHTSPAQPRSRRWPWILGVLALSGLLHLVFIDAFTGAFGLSLPKASSNQIVTATLQPATLPEPVAPEVEKEPAPKPKPKRKPPVQKEQPPVPPVAVDNPSITPEPTPQPDTSIAKAEDPSDATSDQATPPPDLTDKGAPLYKINLPPSAELKYDVQKTSKDGQPMYGRGSIHWQTDGNQYAIDGDAGVLFFTVLNFRSEGTIDAGGIAPELYSEKRFRRAETATHFHRERNTISFSASTKSYPRNGGEQDRASVVWQLAGIGRGDTDKFKPGAQIDLLVAGTRDAETWSMVVVGEEEITIAGEAVQAWHITRPPRAGSHDQQLDFWLAPQQNWYPVRLRYTEANGDFLDMSLTSLSATANLGAP